MTSLIIVIYNYGNTFNNNNLVQGIRETILLFSFQMYDITNAKSYKNLGKWLKILRRYCSPEIPVYLIGNKSDCTDNSRKITKDQGERYALQLNLKGAIETSAKADIGIREAFVQAVTDILSRKPQSLQKAFPSASDDVRVRNTEVSCICCI